MRKNDWIDSLEKLEKPKVNLTNHKSNLQRVLRRELYGESNERFTLSKLKGVILMIAYKKAKVLVPALSIALLFVFYSAFFTGTHTVAYATLQVNPALQFSIDNDNKVVEVVALNEDAKSLVNELKLIGTELNEALKSVAGKAIELGLVNSDKEFILSFRSAKENINNELLNQLAKEAKQAVSVSIVEKNLSNEVKTVVISNELFEAALKEGVLPSDYIDLIEANVSQETIQKIILLSNTEGINKVKFLEELDTINSALVDMLEAGIDEKQAITLLQGSLVADKEVEELSTIVAAMIDIKGAGGNPEQSLALIRAALEQGVDQKTLLEEITTLNAAYIDMIEGGISEAAAGALIKEAMKSDPALEEITTITAEFIDLVEEGMSESVAMDKIQSAINP